MQPCHWPYTRVNGNHICNNSGLSVTTNNAHLSVCASVERPPGERPLPQPSLSCYEIGPTWASPRPRDSCTSTSLREIRNVVPTVCAVIKAFPAEPSAMSSTCMNSWRLSRPTSDHVGCTGHSGSRFAGGGTCTMHLLRAAASPPRPLPNMEPDVPALSTRSLHPLAIEHAC